MDNYLQLGKPYSVEILSKPHEFNNSNKVLRQSFDNDLVYIDESDDQPRFDQDYEWLIDDGFDEPEPVMLSGFHTGN